MQQMQMMGMPQQQQQPQDMNKVFQSESEFLELTQHEDKLSTIEKKILEKYGYPYTARIVKV